MQFKKVRFFYISAKADFETRYAPMLILKVHRRFFLFVSKKIHTQPKDRCNVDYRDHYHTPYHGTTGQSNVFPEISIGNSLPWDG